MENKTTKYLKYAIGEILLVVIGILIALQVNNWNEDRKTKMQTQKFLVSLSEELSNNIEIITAYQKKLQKIADDTYHYLELMNGDTIPSDSTLVNLTRFVGPIYKIEITKTAINDIIRSGSLDEIKDSQLRKSLQLIPSRYDDLENRQNNLWIQWTNSAEPYYFKHSSLLSMFRSIDEYEEYELPESKYSIDKEAFYKNRDFTNILISRLIQVTNQKRETSATVEDLSNINNHIIKHINSL